MPTIWLSSPARKILQTIYRPILRDLLLCIYSDERPDPAEHNFDACEIMARFTVVRWSDVETLREGIGTLVVIRNVSDAPSIVP